MTLALNGGEPIRSSLLPYSRQSVSAEDVQAVVDVLHSDWLTTGPKIVEFEQAFASFVGVKHAVAVSSGTAALHAAMHAIDVSEGDEVIVPAMTFAATANVVVYQGGTPVFADVNSQTLLIDIVSIEKKLTKKTKAIIAVDYAGQPCDYDVLSVLAQKHGLSLIDDACHALGGAQHGHPVGSLAEFNTFSFHPAKPLTTGEGGMITTDTSALAERMRHFRNHCITSDHRERQEQGSWFYEQVDLGYNYRLTDIQCALGLSQIKNVPAWTKRRQEIAAKYDQAFAELDTLNSLLVRDDVSHAYHLYVIKLNLKKLTADRSKIFTALRAENIGVNVHYIPVHLHPFYRDRFGTGLGLCPVAEEAYEHILSLPIFAEMTDEDTSDVIEAVQKVCHAYAL